MEKKVKIVSPIYQQIAVDIASKIANGDYEVGEKIYARSVLASQYGVSSETSRRAICILSDIDVVATNKGSGVIIKSREKAIKFLKQYNEVKTINDLKNDILNSLERQKNENDYLKEKLSQLIDKTDRFKSINPFMPFEICLSKDTPHIEKTLSEINFWHNTSATVICIKRNDCLEMSPGPYAVLHENDILYFVGDEECYDRVNKFIYP
ncbi:GntR family transcriptional regulator [Clostridium gelidum]|uniref:GntR family transcriptional regulator n=1 Tax=Clostridium gelidum TaxID=704125 RepID=A0ABM7T233_9CLOT|nr:GntR family transcriptional regulator [Clostridium gelidum]BCZ44950.1 GntR family transcriptional regulator [Clostridium gelidum]